MKKLNQLIKTLKIKILENLEVFLKIFSVFLFTALASLPFVFADCFSGGYDYESGVRAKEDYCESGRTLSLDVKLKARYRNSDEVIEGFNSVTCEALEEAYQAKLKLIDFK